VDYHLEREIRLSEESQYKNLYSWSLQEFDADGSKVGSDQVPWDWSLYFTASELRLISSIKFERPYKSDDEEENNVIEESEIISAILHPGMCGDGQSLQDDVSYSMFGTDRRIKDFRMCIEKKIDNESCTLWGCVSYTTEIDFNYETTDDTVQIYICLSPERFNSLAEIIKMQRADVVQVRLDKVSGLYSEWSPSISTNRVKVLARADDQKIVFPEGCDITPPKLGEVGEFSLSITQRNKVNPKQDLRSINIYKLFEKQDGAEKDTWEEEFAGKEPDVNSLLLAQLSRNELALKKLRTPLWLVFILLLLLFLKLVL